MLIRGGRTGRSHATRFQTVVQKGTAAARPSSGTACTSGRRPRAGRDYFYRFLAGDSEPDRPHQDRARRRHAGRSPALRRLRRQHYEDATSPLRRIAEEQFDFVSHRRLHLKGTIWRPDRIAACQHSDEIYARGLSECYALYKAITISWRRMHRRRGRHLTITRLTTTTRATSTSDTPPEIFLLRRAAAYQAYEAMPLRAARCRQAAMRIYRRLQFGSLIDLSVLDTRQWCSVSRAATARGPTVPAGSRRLRR